MKLISCLLLFISLAFGVYSQKQIRTYHDAQKSKIDEDYFVSKADNTLIIGKYKRYYPNGKLMVEGNFDDGKKLGLFTEYHENGTPARKLNYVNGLRHGFVEIYNDE